MYNRKFFISDLAIFQILKKALVKSHATMLLSVDEDITVHEYCMGKLQKQVLSAIHFMIFMKFQLLDLYLCVFILHICASIK